jgi:phosphofructokinase-like protein
MGSIGVLTAGGDCPGLNAVIRAVVRRCEAEDRSVVGVRNGWEGLMADDVVPLGRNDVGGIIGRGGTILGTSRMDPYVHGDGYESVRRTIEANDIEALVVVGGDGTLRTAARLDAEGLPVVGVPKTIDNDIGLTDVTFGFHTAVQIATDAIDRLRTTAESHHRVMLVEVMGRTTGWIAAYAGIAGGADAILVPEVPWDPDGLCELLTARQARGRSYSIVVVAEGIESPVHDAAERPHDVFGFSRLGGVAYDLAPIVEEHTGIETRVVVLGHIQRGGTPTAFDRVLATRLGAAAAEVAMAGDRGVMVSLHRGEIGSVDLVEACNTPRGLDPATFATASLFFG